MTSDQLGGIVGLCVFLVLPLLFGLLLLLRGNYDPDAAPDVGRYTFRSRFVPQRAHGSTRGLCKRPQPSISRSWHAWWPPNKRLFRVIGSRAGNHNCLATPRLRTCTQDQDHHAPEPGGRRQACVQVGRHPEVIVTMLAELATSMS